MIFNFIARLVTIMSIPVKIKISLTYRKFYSFDSKLLGTSIAYRIKRNMIAKHFDVIMEVFCIQNLLGSILYLVFNQNDFLFLCIEHRKIAYFDKFGARYIMVQVLQFHHYKNMDSVVMIPYQERHMGVV